MSVELVEDNSRFHAGEALLEIHLENPVHVLGEVDHDRGANGLSCQAGSAPARQNGQTVIRGQRNGRRHVVSPARHHDSQGLNLINARVGAVQEAGESVRVNFTRKLLPELCGELLDGLVRAFHGVSFTIKTFLDQWISRTTPAKSHLLVLRNLFSLGEIILSLLKL